MLDAIESRITAVVADGLQSRPSVTVVQSPTGIAAPPAGNGFVRVSVPETHAAIGFERDTITLPGGAATRRVAPIAFTARMEFVRTPAAADAAGLVAARALLLGDASLIIYNLAVDDIRSGKAFKPAAPDPGFDITSFQLSTGTLTPEFANGVLTAVLEYNGGARIWPPGTSTPGGIILAVDAVTSVTPLQFTLDHAVTSAGDTNRLRLRSLDHRRALAVTVSSDLPPAQRGSILTGAAGVETGVRIVTVAAPETIVDYQAPSGNLGTTRLEYIAVHIATTDLRRGVHLGSIAIPLRPVNP